MADLWAVPYIDQPLPFWRELSVRFGEHVEEVYFPMPEGLIVSGRGRQPEEHLADFLRGAPLTKAVLLNPIVLVRPVEAVAAVVLSALRRLRDDYGVQRVTVTDLTLAGIIRGELPDFTITASTLMGISTAAQVNMLEGQVDALTPANTLVRDLAGLRRLRQAFTGRIRLLVNEACLPGCPYRPQHFYEMGYGDHFPQSLCQPLLERQPWLRLTGAWILPRHLHYYDGIYDSLKLAGRVTLRDPARYMRVLTAYVERQDILPCDIGAGPASPLRPVPMPDALFERLLTCDKNCLSCSVCREHDSATASL
ncbi:MAG: hypothetical protein ACYC5O_07910 [Anaerolineae bacterium]